MGTCPASKRRGDLATLAAGEEQLFNPGVILVNPDMRPTVKKEMAQAFVDGLVSPQAQKSIADYRIDGQQRFLPNSEQPAA
jgi:tungstate transport system substrate-binding protein